MPAEPLLAHTLAEAYLYFLATPCPSCGQGPVRGTGAAPESDSSPDDNPPLCVQAKCDACQAETSQVFKLIDGGAGQLSAAEDALKKMGAPLPHLASIAKKEEIIYVHGRSKPLKLASNSAVKKLLQYVRDEAHRFAQHYHHILRKKKTIRAPKKS